MQLHRFSSSTSSSNKAVLSRLRVAQALRSATPSPFLSVGVSLPRSGLQLMQKIQVVDPLQVAALCALVTAQCPLAHLVDMCFAGKYGGHVPFKVWMRFM